MRVGLVMICKDEESNIERAITSLKPLIDTWVIVDTGSTDGTKDVIRHTLADISGFLEDRPWVNFEHNRTEALELCRGRMDWAIMIDADDNFVGQIPPRTIWENTNVDAMHIRIKHGNALHGRLQIFRIDADWCYKGVVHEIPVCRSRSDARILKLPETCWFTTRCEGVRSKDPLKYQKDAELLMKEHEKNPSDKRTIFYLAQSWRDAGDREKALKWYKKYIDMSGGWEQERYISYFNLVNLETDTRQILSYAWQAVDLCPERLDVQAVVLGHFLKNNLPLTQELFALLNLTKNRKIKEHFLFANPAMYNYGFDEAFSVIAFQKGHFKESQEAALRCSIYHPDEKAQIIALNNARVAGAKMLE